ncbi:outer membrane protein assembly factor BamB family protein [Haloarchaeobius baliensis]|uniref:PQQ-binding-like beta-propeller repeat protein n=1 Tax=Haloarchaeobius baliensis TaxID=1670458 RepID=UPI003F884DFB
MDRRTFLAGTLAAASFSAGCASSLDLGSSTRTRSTPSDTPPLSATNDAFAGEFTEGGAWPMYCMAPGRESHNPDTSFPTGEVGAAWLRTPVPDQRTFQTTHPITDDRRVYVGSGLGTDERDGSRNGFVATFDGATGERTWWTQVTTGRVRDLSYDDGRVLAISSERDPDRGLLTALDVTDGTVEWQTELPSASLRGMLVTNGAAYISAYGSGLSAVALDGTYQWDRAVASGDEDAATAPCAVEDSIYVGTDRGRLVAFEAETGQRRWQQSVARDGHRPRFQTTPTVADGTIYASATNYTLYAVDAADGAVRWQTRLLSKSYGNAIPSVTVVDDRLYVNTIHGGVLALRRSDGREQWRSGKYGGQGPPAAAGEYVVIPTTGGNVEAYDAAGERRWQFNMEAFDAPGMAAYIMQPRVALAHGRIYIALADGRVFSLGAR